MILVFGGTTEGKIIAGLLDELKKSFWYSTKTKLSPIKTEFGRIVQGGMNEQELEAFCISQNIRIILNGSHPFAFNLHLNIAKVANKLHLPVIRLERNFPEIENRSGVICVDDFASALDYLQLHNFKKLLSLTGVQTIPALKPFWQKQECWFRILDRQESYRKAKEYAFPENKLIGETPVDSVQYELDLIQRIKPEAILTKESGNSGFFINKLKAAQKANIPFIVVRRPSLPSCFQLVYNQGELREKLLQY